MTLPVPETIPSVPARSPVWDEFLPKFECLGDAIEGVGIHTGKRFRVSLARSQDHAGLRFCALRGGEVFEAPALWTRLSGTARATALVLRSLSNLASKERFELKTIEHFLAAAHASSLAGYDLCVEALDALAPDEAFELPILDGSASRWLEWIDDCLGARLEIASPRKVWKALRHFEIVDGAKSVRIYPHADESDARTVYSCRVDFPRVWRQSTEFVCDWRDPRSVRDRFRAEIAPARTFGFERELKDLEARGLARGGSFENAILLGEEKVVNPEGFRLPQELAAHKLLDGVGDFALLGAPLLGRIELDCAGHSMHLRAVAEAVRKGALVSGLLDRQGRFLRDET